MRYNMGLSVPETEANISAIPTGIYYDEERMTATVRFDIRQNSDANATIDPSHLLFKFMGEDADGNAMDPQYDEYMGVFQIHLTLRRVIGHVEVVDQSLVFQ